MPSTYTTRLRLTLPATGELTNAWGPVVNNGITELVDASIAGAATLSTWGGAGVDYTLSNNNGVADEARCMFIVASGSPGENKDIICPSVSKLYVVRNSVSGGFTVRLKTAAGTGVTVENGRTAVLRCDGTNVVDAITQLPAFAVAGGTANQVQYLNASRELTGSANLTFNGTRLTVADFADSSLTSGRVTYATTGGNLTDSANLTFNGTTLTAAGLAGPLNGTVGATTLNTGAFSSIVLGVTSPPGAQRLQLFGDSTAGAANSLFRRFSNDATGPSIALSKSRGTTETATTIVQNGDEIGSLVWQASDGSVFSPCAEIRSFVDGVPGAGSLPTGISFATTPSGSLTGTSRLSISSTGAITSSDLANAVGYKGVPVNEQSAAYGLQLTDQGKTIVHPITDNNARTFTIPANGSIAFPVGTTITFINMINTLTIAITTDTMYLAGAGTTGSRTLAAFGMATAVKITSTSWIISGNGLS